VTGGAGGRCRSSASGARGRLCTLALLCAGALLARPAQPKAGAPGAGITGLEQLKPVYDSILNSQFAAAEHALEGAHATAPPEACEVLAATGLWWRILLDPADTQFDRAFTTRVASAIDGAERWTAREPDRPEAWFYLGAAYGVRVSWRVERGERLAAARDGKRIKEALERAIELEPSFDDARFGIGLYKYYADIAPAAAKVLRFLLVLPGGDRVTGLKDMEAASARGTLVAGEAQYQLHWIYFWYEHEPVRGLALLEQLTARYPANPHFLQRIAEVRAQYFHDPAGSLAVWQQLADRASQMGTPRLAEVRGRLGAAEQLDVLFETDAAVDELRRVIALRPKAPVGALARAQLLFGRTLDRLGDRHGAEAAWRAAIAAASIADKDDIVDQAQLALRRGSDVRHGAAYRKSLQGWRALDRGDVELAEQTLADAAAQAPDDWMIRARLGRARALHGETDAAMADFDRVIAARPQVPGVALSAAYLWSGELLEQRGQHGAAAQRYRSATRVFGGDSRLATQATRALARLAH
jgi:tetratricopeptide (TPR) repeat protein